MTSLRSGSTKVYSTNWGAAFGEKKSAGSKSASGKPTKTKAAKKSTPKKKAGKK